MPEAHIMQSIGCATGRGGGGGQAGSGIKAEEGNCYLPTAESE